MPAGREVRRLMTALQFLTRLPVPDPGWEEGQLRAALRYFPLAGAVVGLIGGAVWWVAAASLPPGVAAGLALGAMLLATGALHEDGLGDVADGLGGHAGRERALEIMRDSRVGSYALVALIVAIGLRWTALASLPREEGLLALVIAAAAGRAAIVPATAMAGPARDGGLGASLGQGAGMAELGIALALALALAALGGAAGVLALVLALILGFAVLRLLVRRIGGHTGDGLGAIAAVGETAALVTLAGPLA